MQLLVDIGNTHTHLGLANGRRVVRHMDVSTRDWNSPAAAHLVKRWLAGRTVSEACVCSVVPKMTRRIGRAIGQLTGATIRELTAETICGVGIRYPKPGTIGADRLANAIAARHHFGAPSVVVDFGTAVTFDVVSAEGNYIGGIIAPGLAAMTDYLHEKTALLPRITIRNTRSVIGRSTEEAMLIGAVHGYRGLIRELIGELKQELKCKTMPVIATGGYARLFDRSMPEITSVEPLLTLEGLRLFLVKSR